MMPITIAHPPPLPFRSNLLLRIPLHPNLRRLRAIVRPRNLLEPRVLQCLLGVDAVLRVIHKDPPQEVEEELVEGRVGGDDVLDSSVSLVETLLDLADKGRDEARAKRRSGEA
jgi:hypothetical protein